MDQIWSRLIRRDGQPGRGSPDSREQAMRQLAQQLLGDEDPERAYADLDGEALEGLRRDVIVRNNSQPWSPLPAFTHDILRDFAVARFLGSGGGPAERLREFGAPRWALPAARLAFEAQLRHRRVSGATLEDLQLCCGELSVSAEEARWADVPFEAVLGLPDAGEILAGSWNWLCVAGGSELGNVLRLVGHRHTNSGKADPEIAGPVAALLIEHWWPGGLQEQVEVFLREDGCAVWSPTAPQPGMQQGSGSRR